MRLFTKAGQIFLCAAFLALIPLTKDDLYSCFNFLYTHSFAQKKAEKTQNISFIPLSSHFLESQDELIAKTFSTISNNFYWYSKLQNTEVLAQGLNILFAEEKKHFSIYNSGKEFLDKNKDILLNPENIDIFLQNNATKITRPLINFHNTLFKIENDVYYCDKFSQHENSTFSCLPSLLYKIKEKLSLSSTEIIAKFFGETISRIDSYSLFLNATQYLELKKSLEEQPKNLEYSVDKNILYFKIADFTKNIHEEFINIYKDIVKNKLFIIVLDLRDNTGGILEEAVKISNFFLTHEDIITVKTLEKNVIYKATASIKIPYPLVVLVNEKSASASEIVASSLQENNRAVLMGTPTFGKGSVQTVFPLPQGHGLKLTTAHYFSPRHTDKETAVVIPDILLPLNSQNTESSSEEKEKLFSYLEKFVREQKSIKNFSNKKFKYFLQKNYKRKEDMKIFTGKYNTLHYETLGSGSPLILFNGYTDSMQDWDETFINLLAHQHQLIFIDYWGTGNSKIENAQDATFAKLIDDITLFLKSLNISKISLLGRSMGGYLVQEFCDHHPQLIEKIILICTSAGGKNRLYGDPHVMSTLRSLSQFPEEQKFQKMHDIIFTSDGNFSITEQEFNNRKLKIGGYEKIKVSLETEKLQLQAINQWFAKVDEKSITISCPTLLLSGDKDQITPMANSEILHKKIKNSLLKIIPNTGHGLVTQQPKLIAQEINMFLEGR